MLPVSCIHSVAVGRNVGAQSVARIVTELSGEDGAVGVLLHAVAVGAPTFPLSLVARLVIKEHHTHTVAPPTVKLAEVLFAPARVIWRVEACAHPLALARFDGAEVERVGHKRRVDHSNCRAEQFNRPRDQRLRAGLHCIDAPGVLLTVEIPEHSEAADG